MPSIADIGALSASFGSEEELAVRTLFPTKNRFELLMMITELNPNEVVPLSILGVIRRRWHSKVILMYEEEFRMNRKSKDRKGVLEMAEIFSAGRRLASEDDD